MGIIYHLFCTVTGKAYVGQTWETLEKRWAHHRKPSSRCIKLQRALQKYGPDVFVRSVLTQGLMTQADMDAAERYWIEYFDTIRNGYNLREGGSFGKHSKETRERISLAEMGNKKRLGQHPSEETREKLRFSHFGNTAALGYRHTDGVRSHLSSVQGGRPFVDQHGVRYETLGEAARALSLDSSNISKVLHGRGRSLGGYTFRYIEVE